MPTGEFVIHDVFFQIDDSEGTPRDLSAELREIGFKRSGEAKETTAMKSTKDRTFKKGLTSYDITLRFNQTFDANKVDAVFFPLVDVDPVDVVIRSTSDAASATNPEFTGTIMVTEYELLAGATGDVAEASITVQGSGVLSRGTGA